MNELVFEVALGREMMLPLGMVSYLIVAEFALNSTQSVVVEFWLSTVEGLAAVTSQLNPLSP